MATLLIVDDRAINREFLIAILRDGSHRLLEASNGVEALKIIMSQPIDLIITDILMPTMNGFELVQQLQFPLVNP